MGIIQALDKELFKEYSLAVSKGGFYESFARAKENHKFLHVSFKL